jgi:hypothetical protein
MNPKKQTTGATLMRRKLKMSGIVSLLRGTRSAHEDKADDNDGKPNSEEEEIGTVESVVATASHMLLRVCGDLL